MFSVDHKCFCKYYKMFYLLNFDFTETHIALLPSPIWWLGHPLLVLEVSLLELSVIELPEGFCLKNFTFHTKHLKIFTEFFLCFKYFTFENVFSTKQLERNFLFMYITVQK